MISYDGSELTAVLHRIAQAWKCFHKWQHVFLATAEIGVKLQLWTKAVYRSMVWGLQTIRKDKELYSRLATAQKLMVRKMMHLKRHTLHVGNEKVGLEPWLDFYKRSMSRAKADINRLSHCIKDLVRQERHRWTCHIAHSTNGDPG